jgi:prepilin-type N-terminal cleavage/methylation domain-containing protein
MHRSSAPVRPEANARSLGEDRGQGGFTIVELVIAMALLAIIAAPLATVFWSGLRTASAAAHRTDGASVASREIERMRAVPYAQVGFYADEPGYSATFETFTTVTLGSVSPSTGKLVPQIEPLSPDPSAAAGYAPDPDPANASPIVLGGIRYSVARSIVWINANDASSTFDKAYKRLTVVVTWTDQVGVHNVRQDSVLYPGGLGAYSGPMGGAATTTTTTGASAPLSPVLAAITALASPADQTQVALSWSQPAGGTAPTSYSIEYSTNPSFPTGNFAIVGNLSPSILSYTVTSLTPDTTYYFEIIAYAGTTSSPPSNRQSLHTAPLPGPVCTLGGLSVVGATSLSTTGSILQTNGKMSENLTLSRSTSGPCTDSYQVAAADPTNAADPGSPYPLTGSGGSYNATIAALGSKSWAVGLHTFTVQDVSTNTTTSVVKTFKICVHGAASC